MILIASIFSSIHFQYKNVSFTEKCHFRPKVPQHVNTPFKDTVLILSQKTAVKFPFSIVIKVKEEIIFTLQSVSKETVVTIKFNLSRPTWQNQFLKCTIVYRWCTTVHDCAHPSLSLQIFTLTLTFKYSYNIKGQSSTHKNTVLIQICQNVDKTTITIEVSLSILSSNFKICILHQLFCALQENDHCAHHIFDFVAYLCIFFLKKKSSLCILLHITPILQGMWQHS